MNDLKIAGDLVAVARMIAYGGEIAVRIPGIQDELENVPNAPGQFNIHFEHPRVQALVDKEMLSRGFGRRHKG
jgi:hypothetical protein